MLSYNCGLIFVGMKDFFFFLKKWNSKWPTQKNTMSWGLWKHPKNRPKNTKNAFLVCFWAYVGQPHGHIGWAIPMPFVSMNSTNPRTAPWNFNKKILRIGDFEKWPLFESAIFNFIFSKKKKKKKKSFIPTRSSPPL
mgnify:CR=1 FL=1